MGKVDVKPSLFSKTSLLTKTSAVRPSPDSVSRKSYVPQKLPKVENTAVYKVHHGTCKPMLFNKSLAVGDSQDGCIQKTIVPSLFSTQNLLPRKPKEYGTLAVDNKQKQSERKERKRKLDYNLSKQSSFEKMNMIKIPAKVTQNAGKPKKKNNFIKSEKKKRSKKKKDAKIEFVAAKMKEFKLVDDDFKKDQLRIMRSKLKQESEGLFVDSKQGNYDLMKQEKEKVTREKVLTIYKSISYKYIHIYI